MFRYHICTSVAIGGEIEEWNWCHESPCQFRPGDVLHHEDLEELTITHVAWYIDDPGSAFMELELIEFGDGEPKDIDWLLNPADEPTAPKE